MNKIKIFEASTISDLEQQVNNFMYARGAKYIDFKINQFKTNSHGMPERLSFVGTLIYNDL